MRKQKGSKRREMESQLSALRKEIGEKQWAKIEQVLEGDYDEDEWERVVGEALAGVEDGDGGEEGDEGEEEGDEKPSWDDDDEAYGDYEEYEDGAAEGQDGEMEFDDGPVNMVRLSKEDGELQSVAGDPTRILMNRTPTLSGSTRNPAKRSAKRTRRIKRRAVKRKMKKRLPSMRT